MPRAAPASPSPTGWIRTCSRVDRTGSWPGRAFGLPPGGVLLGFTGSIRPWHGLDIAIAALAELPERIELVVAGDGPVRVQLEQQALALGVGHRVRWLGALAHERVPQMLAACDLALAPYPELPNFGFSPLKLYEYLAAGVPVVASDIGQIRHALSGGRWGRLVPPGDASALAAAVTSELADLPAARVAQRRPGSTRCPVMAGPNARRESCAPRHAEDVTAESRNQCTGRLITHCRPTTRCARSNRRRPGWPTAPGSSGCSGTLTGAGSRPSSSARATAGRPFSRSSRRRERGATTAGSGCWPRVRPRRSCPASLGVDRQGHAHLVSYHPGRELVELSDADFVNGCRQVGVALRRLHDCGAVLDRSWGWPRGVGPARPAGAAEHPRRG